MSFAHGLRPEFKLPNGLFSCRPAFSCTHSILYICDMSIVLIKIYLSVCLSVCLSIYLLYLSTSALMCCYLSEHVLKHLVQR